MTTIGAFSQKIKGLFPIFKKGQGRPPPPSTPLVTRLLNSIGKNKSRKKLQNVVIDEQQVSDADSSLGVESWLRGNQITSKKCAVIWFLAASLKNYYMV